MADNLERQKEQYQQRFNEFLNKIESGTFDEELNKMKKRYKDISPQLQQEINQQIKEYQSKSPSQSVAGFVNFLGKSTANSFLGPIAGISVQDFQNPERLADKAKSKAIQTAQNVVAQSVPSAPSIINSIQNRKRNGGDDSLTREFHKKGIYGNRMSHQELLNNPDYKPESYDTRMRKDFPKKYNKIKVIQDNSGNSFYSNYKILHNEDSEELTDEFNKHLIKFHITNSDNVLIFRMANFDGFTDSVNVSYNDVRYFGRPEPLKQYDSVTRDVAFSYDVVVEEETDIYPIYKKLDILTGLCYPNSYTNNDIIQPNILRLSVGHYFNRMPFFPTNISYNASDEVYEAHGKPKIITVNVNGALIQPENDPKLELGPNKFFIDNDTPNERDETKETEIPKIGNDLEKYANNVSLDDV